MKGDIIVVVDSNRKPFPPATDLVKLGVRLSVAVAWQRARREMSPAGLARKLKDLEN